MDCTNTGCKVRRLPYLCERRVFTQLFHIAQWPQFLRWICSVMKFALIFEELHKCASCKAIARDPSWSFQAQRHQRKPQIKCLDRRLVCNRYNSLWNIILHWNISGFPGLNWLSLQVNVSTIGFGFLLELSVRLDSADKLFSRSG